MTALKDSALLNFSNSQRSAYRIELDTLSCFVCIENEQAR